MPDPKVWKAGNADEDWKVSICQRDIRDAKAAIKLVEYILGDAIEDFTGQQIKAAVAAYVASAEVSIERGEAA
jgi:hypothetical protein